MRISELCQLKKKDLTGLSVMVIGKGGRVRRCYISPFVYALLESVSGTHYMFESRMGNRLTPKVVRKRFKEISEDSGIKINPHDRDWETNGLI